MTTNQTGDEWRDSDGNEIDEDDRGLVYDIRTLVNRRSALGLFGGVAVVSLLAACSSTGASSGAAAAGESSTPSVTSTDGTGTVTSTATSTATSVPSVSAEALTEVPDETAGPYPGDGSNGVDVLGTSGIVRSDIRSSFGSSSTTAEGVPLNIQLTVRDVSTGNALAGAAVYLWHCNRDGEYSLYGDGVQNENYLRGVQQVDSNGMVTFTSIYPGGVLGPVAPYSL